MLDDERHAFNWQKVTERNKSGLLFRHRTMAKKRTEANQLASAGTKRYANETLFNPVIDCLSAHSNDTAGSLDSNKSDGAPAAGTP